MPILTTRFKNKTLNSYVVKRESSLSIGRLPDNDIVIENAAVSGSHARIVARNDAYVVEDLDSTNGTFVNNKRIRSRKLKDEDIIVIGKHEIVFHMSDEGHEDRVGSTGVSGGMTSRDRTAALDAGNYKKMLAQNVYDANKATLLILRFKGRQVRKYVLQPNRELTIGRLANNDIVIENDAVSGKHAKIFALDDEYCLQDFDSTNGTLVNGKPIQTHMLKDEDIITIGKHELVYCQYETYTLEETLLPYAGDAANNTDGTRAVNVRKLKASASHGGATGLDASPPDGRCAFLSFAKGGQGDVAIENKGIKIGKDPDADIRVKGFMVGSVNVMISKTGSGYYLSSQGRKKGAKVNGKAVKAPTKLTDEDTIEVGSIKLIFHLDYNA